MYFVEQSFHSFKVFEIRINRLKKINASTI